MAKYALTGQDTADGTLAHIGLKQDATTQRRGKIYDWMFGSEGTVADNPFLYQLQRADTGLGTSTAVPLRPLDPADAAAILDGGENYTANPTLQEILMKIPLNQRATFRWACAPGSEIVLPATANLSIVGRTPTSAAVAISSTMLVEEQ